MIRSRIVLLLSASVACIATAGLAQPVSAPPAGAGGFDALLADMARLGAGPANPDDPQQTRGFRMAADEDALDLAMIAAHGSNAAGAIVGDVAVEGGSHAVIRSAEGDLRDLGDLPGGEVSAVARGINEAGQVVGRGHGDDGERAFLWDEAAGMRDLTLLADADPGVVLRDAAAIDEDGRIAGRATVDGVDRAFLWTPGAGTLDLAEPVRGARAGIVELLALETDGPAVGRGLSDDGRDRPVSWFPGTDPVDLGDLPGGAETGVAHDIDSLGWIVGQSAAEDGNRAFVWTEDSGMMDLNDLLETPSDVVLTAAVSIVNDGRILAYGNSGDTVHFYRLSPVAMAPGAIVGLIAEKGMTDLQSYVLSDLGGCFALQDGVPILSMDETGRVVGSYDVLAEACLSLSGLEDVTNFFPDDTPIFSPAGLGSGDGTRRPGTRLTPTSLFRPITPDRGFTPSFGRRPGGGTGPGPIDPPTNPPVGPTIDPPVDIAPVPLPPAWLGLLAALGLLGLVRRRTVPA